jgi:hypothetical protein
VKTTVIHHSADYDGIFCREIARKFLPDAELIGWDFSDPPLKIPADGMIYILDLPVDRIFGFRYEQGRCGPDFLPKGFDDRVIWIDHHKSSIETHPSEIEGYRIDGVAACRLAWQWFSNSENRETVLRNQSKQDFSERKVSEPLAIRLAGEYDIWDHRGDGDIEFQFGLDCQGDRSDYSILISSDGDKFVPEILHAGSCAMACYAKRDADIVRARSFVAEFEGLKFLVLNTARSNSGTFTAKDVLETGHDALMSFYWTGKAWSVSMYHAKHRTDLDLSAIAVKRGGGGHRGACGFMTETFPFNETPKP